MIALEALFNFATINLFICAAWKHRHDRVWQLGTLALLGYVYFLIVPDWMRDFTVVR